MQRDALFASDWSRHWLFTTAYRWRTPCLFHSFYDVRPGFAVAYHVLVSAFALVSPTRAALAMWGQIHSVIATGKEIGRPTMFDLLMLVLDQDVGN